MPPKRSLGFTQAETESLLESIRSVLPIGGTEWGTVENLHLQEWPEVKRSKDSLRRKFSSLYRTKMPTGNPACPPLVRLAKQVQGEIKFRVNCSDGDNNGDESSDDDEDNDSSSTDLQMGGVVVAPEDAPPVVVLPPDVSATVPVSAPVSVPVFVPTAPAFRERDQYIRDQCQEMGILSPLVMSEVNNLGLGVASSSAGLAEPIPAIARVPAMPAIIGKAPSIAKSPAGNEGMLYQSSKKKKKKRSTSMTPLVNKRAKNNGYGEDTDEFSMGSYMKMVMMERENERKEEKERLREEKGIKEDVRKDEEERRREESARQRSKEDREQRRHEQQMAQHEQQMAQQNQFQQMMMMKMFQKDSNQSQAPANNTTTLHQEDDDDDSTDNKPSFIIGNPPFN